MQSAGTLVGLFSPFAKFGSENGQEWSLTTSCAVCNEVSRFIAPVSEIQSATRVAKFLIFIAGGLDAIVILVLLVTSSSGSWGKNIIPSLSNLIAVGSLFLAVAPMLFLYLLPEQVPIHLAWGGWLTLLIGLLTLMVATSLPRVILQQTGRHSRGGGYAGAAGGGVEDGWAAATGGPSSAPVIVASRAEGEGKRTETGAAKYGAL